MKTKDRPFESHISIINSFLDYAEIPQREKEILKKELENYIKKRILNGEWYHPLITKFHTDWYRELYRVIDNKDPYKKIKEKSNEKAKEILSKLRFDGIRDILKLIIIGNKIDFGSHINWLYKLDSLEEDIISINNERIFIDDSNELIDRIKSTRNVFYLFDNNGELIFDTLLLDFIGKYVNKENIFLVAKESPMLNDVVIKDLLDNNINKYGVILSTGSNCFGLHEEDVSKEFKESFRNADLIIAKGQAYFEFFQEYNFKNVFSIFRVKQEIKGDNIPILKPNMNIIANLDRYTGKGLNYKWN